MNAIEAVERLTTIRERKKFVSAMICESEYQSDFASLSEYEDELERLTIEADSLERKLSKVII